MINKNLLKHECSQRGLTLAELAQHLEVDAAALSAKLNGAADFTRGEIISIGQFLSLTQADINAIFFDSGLTKTQEKTVADKPILTPAEAAAYSGIGLNTLRSWAYLASRGKLIFPCFWIGDNLKIPRAAFVEWLNEKGKENVSLPSSVELAPRKR